ncbi:MAG: adenosylcobalamin-dependent ribonucleoside-diphosphate reductase [Chloroflexi bacterium]|nr:MAG: adenosylcobalamin-dependent ribonucleoside-diphosphate reductase [Chloroflexota bacterium]
MLEQQKQASQGSVGVGKHTQLEGIRQKVFMDRYSLKDPSGQALEFYPEQLWARVARGIASVETTEEKQAYWEKRFYEALADFQFVPGGRILAGAGSGHQVTFYNCMPPDQEVLTTDGYRPISEIKIGDLVVTHRNRLRPVVHKFERETEETLYIIRPKKVGYDDLRVTGDHKVYIIRSEWVNKHKSRDGLHLQHEPDWIPAKEIKPGDYVAVAHNGEECPPDVISLQDHIPQYEAKDGKLFKATTRGYHGHVSDWGTHYKIQDRLVLDGEMCYLFGRWLGDGCVTHRTGTDIPSGIKIVFSLDEKNEAKEIARIIEAKFGIEGSIKLSNTERWYDLWVNSMPIGEFFKAFLGCYSYGKRLPDQLMHLPAELTLELLRGLFSADGYLSDNKLGIALSNRTLAIQIHQLLLRMGYLFSVRENTHRLGRVPAYRVQATANECAPLFEQFFGVQAPEHSIDLKHYFEYDNLKWVRIDEIAVEDYSGIVLDIEVEEDHSFISAGIAVSNCYVIPNPEDSRQGILDNLKVMTEIMARGGGVGINLSTLRPRGSYIKTVNGTASGPCSWAQLYSVATGDVIQQGGSRRGALMIMLDDNHPDIEEFITVKRTAGKIEHANLSVCISDKFMEAVKEDADWDLIWQGEVKKTIKARALWDLICKSAWESAEPGMVFMDRYNKESNTWYYENIRCVNPCGEQGLPPWGVCNLGALNLSTFVKDGQMDWERLAETSKVAMRFLDNVIDSNEYFIEENKQAQLGTRRTGLGTMGLADALIKMRVAYGSEASVPLIERIYTTIRDASYEASSDIAVEKGSFPHFDQDKYLQGQFIKRLPKATQKKIREQGIRNAVLLTQAPTGTTSLLSGVSSGIEPVYDFAMVRRDRTGEHILYHPLLQAWRDEHPNEPTPGYFVASNDLTPEEHVRVQATIQRYTDSSISKTVNAPNNHTVEDVQKLYRLAYEMDCKGITYYRDGSRDAVLTRVEDEKKAAAQQEPQMEPVVSIQQGIKARPAVVHGYTRQVSAPEGKINVTINSDDHGPLEVFVNVGKAGSDIAALAEALGRLISLNLRVLSPLSQTDHAKEIAEQLRGIGGSRSVGFGMQQVRSLPDAVARALEMHLEALEAEQEDLVYEEGCRKCYSCGHSEC